MTCCEYCQSECDIVNDGWGRGELWCKECLDEFSPCDGCNGVFQNCELTAVNDGEWFCYTCCENAD